MLTVADFQRESNRIEGIPRVLKAEIEALETLLRHNSLWIQDLCTYVRVIQPDAMLRRTSEIPGVRVGRHVAPPSGQKIVEELIALLNAANDRSLSPHEVHCRYETLHPFTDGNGRSGRALWLWMRGGNAPIGFLHQFYYDTLANLQERSS